MTHRTAGEGRGPFFIPLYRFHPLTIIQIFIYNLACEMTIIFLIAMLVFTRLLLDEILPPYRITIWLIDEVKFVLVCLFEKYQLRRELPVTVPWVEIEYTHEKTNNICPRPPPNYIFFTNSIPLTFFDNIAPMIYWVNTKMRGSYLFMFIKQQGATFLSLK